MKKLINYSVFAHDFYGFNKTEGALTDFLEKHQLQGIEMIQYGDWNSSLTQSNQIVGVHTQFWPTWLDFWNGDKKELIRQFGNTASVDGYYGCSNRKEWVNFYRSELEKAKQAKVKYVLFHVSHVELEHCYTYQFTYSNEEIILAFIEFINQVLEGFEADFEILFENHWFPGLIFTDPGEIKILMGQVKYPKLGFVLDTGHLMNTNLELRSEEDAVSYILNVLQGLGPMKEYIRGIHLNSSLSGAYVKKSKLSKSIYKPQLSFDERYSLVFSHIGKIDRHVPFSHPGINDIIELIDPEYLVLEFTASSLSQLEEYIIEQNKVLGFTIL